MAASHGAGTLKSTSTNGVKLYSLTGNRYVAPWVLAKKRALRKDKEYQRRLDLIHDLRFETATTKIKLTPDDQFVIASGIYPPQVKVYELKELSMKFERHMISEIINFQVPLVKHIYFTIEQCLVIHRYTIPEFTDFLVDS